MFYQNCDVRTSRSDQHAGSQARADIVAPNKSRLEEPGHIARYQSCLQATVTVNTSPVSAREIMSAAMLGPSTYKPSFRNQPRAEQVRPD